MSVMKPLRAFGLLFVGVIVLVPLSTVWEKVYQQKELATENKQLGFPIKLLSESFVGEPGALREARFLLSKKYYSRENLDKLFRWYSKLHQDDMPIHVYVYTNPDIFNENTKQFNYDNIAYDASFYRRGNGAGSEETENEWYAYSPDLSKPDETKTVIIKGKDPHSGKNIIEEKEVANGTLSITIASYLLTGDVEPSGIYYTFNYETTDLSSGGEIMTIRHQDKVPILDQQVRFINDRIGYVFMGWVYAVTTDGGISWNKWDAEKSLPNWKCCDLDLIQDVKISSDGIGTMVLRSNPQRREEIQTLQTTDYGKRWVAR